MKLLPKSQECVSMCVREREKRVGKMSDIVLIFHDYPFDDSVVSSMIRYKRVYHHVLKLTHLQRTPMVQSSLFAL